MFSSDGRLHVLEESDLDTIHLQEENRREPMPLFGKNGPGPVAISPDRSALCVVTNSYIGSYELPDCTEAAWEQPYHPSETTFAVSMAWSPCRNRIAFGQRDSTVLLLNALDGETIHTIGKEGKQPASTVALSPDGSTVAWGVQADLYIHRLGPSGFHAYRRLGKSHFNGIAWHPSGDFLVTVNGDGKADYWDTRTAEWRQSFDWGLGKLRAVAFSDDGDRAACCSEEGHVVVWDVDR
jgi:WD40 repeat protein